MSKHWSKLLLGILALACAGAWGERLFRSKNSHSKQDFVTVHHIFEQFQKGQFLASESLESTETILKRHPELHPKYDTLLALAFFSQQNSTKGVEYARSMLKHVEAQLPALYKEYAHTTLLIAEGDYPSSYQAALNLDGELKGKEGYQTLEAMNTLRLVFLSEKLGDQAQKNLFWDRLEKHPLFLSIQSVFHEGSCSLTDYVNNSRLKAKAYCPP